MNKETQLMLWTETGNVLLEKTCKINKQKVVNWTEDKCDWTAQTQKKSIQCTLFFSMFRPFRWCSKKQSETCYL